MPVSSVSRSPVSSVSRSPVSSEPRPPVDVDPEFLAFLKNEEARAEDGDTDERRAVAIDFYNGEPFGDEEEGRSQIVTRDVAEVVDYMTVSLLRTIVTGDRVVEFEGRTPEQAQYSDDATETITQSFMRRQKGYQLVHDWIKAGLIEITGIVKTYAEPQPPRRVERIVPDLLLGEVDAREAEATGEHDELGNELYRVVVLEPQPTRFCDHAVPNDEFKCAPDARDLDSAVYLAHVPPRTISDLARMGFDPELLADLEKGADSEGMLGNARNGDIAAQVDRQGANQRLNYREEYVLYDLNGDGIAERLMVQRVGERILHIEEVDDHPFEEWCPFPLPHRRIGQSLAEKVMDIQRVRSVVLRQTLDGFYGFNSPTTYVHEDSLGDSTIDDLLTPRVSKIVRYKGGHGPPVERQSRYDSGASLTLLEQLTGERESRTGITRLNQGLDADALNKTATGTALMQAQGQQIEEYLARNFAEALARLFAKKLKIMKRHGGIQPVRVDGKYRQVEPGRWDEEMDVAIRVGPGAGKREQRLFYRQNLGQVQALCMQNGLRIVDEAKIFNLMKGNVADMGLGNVNDYFNDPSELPPPEPKPDAGQARLQAEMQMKQAQMQLRHQEGALKLQLRQASEQARIQLEQFKAQVEAQLAQAKASFEADLALRKLQFEQDLAQGQANRGEPAAAAQPLDPEAAMPENRPGGDLSK